jgi:hypothetical protein
MGTTDAPSGGGRSNPSAQASCDNVCDLPLPTAARPCPPEGLSGVLSGASRSARQPAGRERQLASTTSAGA